VSHVEQTDRHERWDRETTYLPIAVSNRSIPDDVSSFGDLHVLSFSRGPLRRRDALGLARGQRPVPLQLFVFMLPDAEMRTPSSSERWLEAKARVALFELVDEAIPGGSTSIYGSQGKAGLWCSRFTPTVRLQNRSVRWSLPGNGVRSRVAM
jgi:hypothetical protein